MTESRRRISYSLEAAHKNLVAALNEGSRDVCQCVERFVAVLCLTPGGRDELQRRAALIETRSAEGSDYARARELALSRYIGQPRKLSGAKLAIDSLSQSNSTPLFIADVKRAQENVKRELDENVLGLSDAARDSFASWHSECSAVGADAKGLGVDGCRYLFCIAEGDNALMRRRFGGTTFEPIKVAADSLADWVIESTKPPAALPDKLPPELMYKCGRNQLLLPKHLWEHRETSHEDVIKAIWPGKPGYNNSNVNRLVHLLRKQLRRGTGWVIDCRQKKLVFRPSRT
jgi:hypothetical protein